MKNLFKSVSAHNFAKKFLYMGEVMGGNENISTETNAVDYSKPVKEHYHPVDSFDEDVDDDFMAGIEDFQEGDPKLYSKNINKIKNILLDYSETDGVGRLVKKSYIDTDNKNVEFNLYEEKGEEILEIKSGSSVYKIAGEKAIFNGQEISTKQMEYGFNNTMKLALDSLNKELGIKESPESIKYEGTVKVLGKVKEYIFKNGTSDGIYEYKDNTGQHVTLEFNADQGIDISASGDVYKIQINEKDTPIILKNNNKMEPASAKQLFESLINDLRV